jgi:hypothetical protein
MEQQIENVQNDLQDQDTDSVSSESVNGTDSGYFSDNGSNVSSDGYNSALDEEYTVDLLMDIEDHVNESDDSSNSSMFTPLFVLYFAKTRNKLFIIVYLFLVLLF